MSTAFQTRSHDSRPRPSPLVAGIAVVCLALLVLGIFAQAAHNHAVNADTDNCPLCIVMHSAFPAVLAAVAIVLVPVAHALTPSAVRPVLRHWDAQLFTRPPPPGR